MDHGSTPRRVRPRSEAQGARRHAGGLGAAPRARVIAEALEGLGVTHAIGLPDNASAALFEHFAGRSSISVLTVTREGEAFAVASGLWIGGGRPVVVVQNTGLLESGDSLRGTAVRMRVPLLCLVTYRGYATAPALGGSGATDPQTLSRSDVDSAAVVTEPTLRAWGVPYSIHRSDQDVDRIAEAWRQAHDERRPVALLLARGLR